MRYAAPSRFDALIGGRFTGGDDKVTIALSKYKVTLTAVIDALCLGRRGRPYADVAAAPVQDRCLERRGCPRIDVVAASEHGLCLGHAAGLSLPATTYPRPRPGLAAPVPHRLQALPAQG